MNGIKVISVKDVYETVECFGWSWWGAILIIMGIIYATMFFYQLKKDKNFNILFFILMITCPIFAVNDFQTADTRDIYRGQEYTARIEDTVILNDFIENWEIVEYKGDNIYVITPRIEEE